MQRTTRKGLVIVALFIATFLAAIEGTIVSTAMPKITEALHGSQLFTWVISIYLLATVISIPIFGKLADLYGRKRMFNLGVIIFLFGSTACGFAQTMEQLVLFRMIQGVGAGALTTIPFTIIGDVFSYAERGKVQGWVGSVWGISGIIGPLAGGMIVDAISWRWIFFMNIPFGIVSFILLTLALFEQIEKKKHHIDFAGIFLFALSMCTLLYGLTLLKEAKQVTTSAAWLFVIAFAAFLLFLWIEKKAKEPMLPLALFRLKLLNIANVSGFLLGFILVAATFYIPLWVQGVSGLNATSSGLAMLPMSVAWTITGIITGRALAKRSFAWISLLGTAVIIGGSIGLASLQPNTSLFWMMFLSAVLGIGYGMVFTTFTVIVQSSVDWSYRGAAMGAHNLMRSLGQTIGIAVSGLWLSDELYGRQLELSLQTVFMALVLLATLAFIITSFLLGKNVKNALRHSVEN